MFMRFPATFVLAVLLCLLSGAVVAATGNDVSPGETPAKIADLFSKFDAAFTSRAQASSGSLIPYAMRFLGLSFTLMLTWRVLQSMIDAKPLASMIGTILNLMLHYAIVLVFLVPFGSSTGYQGTVAMVSSMADTVATAASGGAFTSGSAAILTGVTAMLKSGFQSLSILNSIASARDVAGTGLFSGLSIGSMMAGFMDKVALLIAGIAILIVTAYAGFQLAKVILYGVVMFALGTAVGPFFLGFLMLPPTRALGEHWFKFMLNAAFIKVVAFFMVGVIVSIGGALIPPITDVSTLQNLGAFAILSSCLALILVYAMVGWVLGQSIQMAGSLFGSSIGGFAPGFGLATLAAAAAGLGVAAMKAAAGGGAGKKSEDGKSTGGTGGSAGAEGSSPAAAGNTASSEAPASSQASASESSSGFTSTSAVSGTSSGASSGAGKAFASGVARVMASGAVGAVKGVGAAVGVAAKAGVVLAGGTRTGSEMSKAFSKGANAFGSGSSAANSSSAKTPAPHSVPPTNSPEKQAYINTAVAAAQTLYADKSQADRDKAVSQAAKNAGSSFEAQQAAAPAAEQGAVSSMSAEQTTSAAGGEETSDPSGSQGDSSSFTSVGSTGSANSQARDQAVATAVANHKAATGASDTDESTRAAGRAAFDRHNAESAKGQAAAQGDASSFGGAQTASERRISQRAENQVSAARARADAVGVAVDRHKAATGASNADQSTRDAGIAGLAQHNESIGRTAYVSRAVEKVDAGMSGYSQELRDQAAKETRESAVKKFDSHSPEVIERYNRAVETKKAQA